MKFSELVEYLERHKKKEHLSLSIDGTKREITAMGKFTSEQYPDIQYIKVLFEDDAFLLIIIQEKEIYFSPKIVHHIKDFQTSDIGEKEIFEYKGKKYKLETKHDYQYVLELMRGKPEDIEGECTFSDYFPVDGGKEYLSLGWTTKDNKRADLHSELLNEDLIVRI